MRPQTAFFRSLAGAAGRTVPIQTIEHVVRPLAPACLDPRADSTSLAADIKELCRRLGLNLARVRARADEIVALAQPQRPVLLAIRRTEDARPVLLLLQNEDPSWVLVDVLEEGRIRHERVAVSRVSGEFELEDAELVLAARVEAMGRNASEERAAAAERLLVQAEQSPLSRLWSFVRPDRSELTIVFGFALVVGILALATPVAVQSLVNFVAFGSLIQPLIVLGILMLFFLGFAGAIQVFKAYVVEILQRRVFVRVVSDLSVRLPRVKLEAYDRKYGPEIVNRYFDVMTVQKAGSSLLLDGLDIVLQSAVGLLVLGFYHPYLVVFDGFLILAIYLILQHVGRGAVKTAIKESKAKYAVAHALEELARVPITYKLAGAPELARARLAELSGNYISRRRDHFAIFYRQLLGTVVLYVVASTALLTLGGWLVIEQQLTLGQLIAAELIVSVALASFVKFGHKLDSYYHLLAGSDKLGQLYDLPLEDDFGESLEPRDPAASVELRHASYAFPGSAGAVIKDFSMRVEAGERVAVIGPRGAGKTVLADLICGLRDARSGLVLFDDLDIRDIANDSLRLQVEIVRGVELIEGSVLDNVRLGHSDVHLEEVQAALEDVGIFDELLERHDGIRTVVSASGAPLSHGTGQLLMIARAIACKPRLIVVDGLLDDLDPAARRTAFERLAGPEAPWTLIVFTRKTEVAELADRVVDAPPSGIRGPQRPVLGHAGAGKQRAERAGPKEDAV